MRSVMCLCCRSSSVPPLSSLLLAAGRPSLLLAASLRSLRAIRQPHPLREGGAGDRSATGRTATMTMPLSSNDASSSFVASSRSSSSPASLIVSLPPLIAPTQLQAPILRPIEEEDRGDDDEHEGDADKRHKDDGSSSLSSLSLLTSRVSELECLCASLLPRLAATEREVRELRAKVDQSTFVLPPLECMKDVHAASTANPVPVVVPIMPMATTPQQTTKTSTTSREDRLKKRRRDANDTQTRPRTRNATDSASAGTTAAAGATAATIPLTKSHPSSESPPSAVAPTDREAQTHTATSTTQSVRTTSITVTPPASSSLAAASSLALRMPRAAPVPAPPAPPAPLEIIDLDEEDMRLTSTSAAATAPLTTPSIVAAPVRDRSTPLPGVGSRTAAAAAAASSAAGSSATSSSVAATSTIARSSPSLGPARVPASVWSPGMAPSPAPELPAFLATSSYRSAASMITDTIDASGEPEPFGPFFARGTNEHEGDKRNTGVTPTPTAAAATTAPGATSAKRKRTHDYTRSAATAETASSTAAAGGGHVDSASPSALSTSPPPVAGRYDDPSLIDVADLNRDLEALGDAAPGIYRGLNSLERELRLLAAERQQARDDPLQHAALAKRARKRARRARRETGIGMSATVDVLLEAEKECLRYAHVFDMKVDPQTGATLVLADSASTSRDDADSYTRSTAAWVQVRGLEGLDPAVVPRAILTRLKLHQLQGVKFLLDNLLGKTNPEQIPTGCILADAMGLGKTLQVLVALHIFARIQVAAGHPRPRFLLVCPTTVLKHWKNESLKLSEWLTHPTQTNDLTITPADKRSMLLPTKILDATVSAADRAMMLHAWRDHHGMLLIGYDLLRDIVSAQPTAAAARAGDIVDECDLTGDGDSVSRVSSDLLSYFQNPGPDVLVLDEAHKVRNLYSTVHQALTTQIHTRRRILLSGYPLQNNLSELYAMIDFVRPAHLPRGHDLGTPKDFSRYFELPTLRAQMSDEPEERRKARRRCWMLFDFMRQSQLMLRRSNTILLKQLPHPLYEIILTLRFSAVQHRVYTALLEWQAQEVRSAAAGGSATPLRALDLVQFVGMLLCHPQVVRKHCHDLPTAASVAADSMADGIGDDAPNASVLASASASSLLKREFIDSVLPTSSAIDLLAHHSAKMVLLLQLVLASKAYGDRVLVFSKWIHTLDYVENMFEAHNAAFESRLSQEDLLLRAGEKIRWGRFDGSTPQAERQALIQQFGQADSDNDPHSHQLLPDVMLISTLCGEGINLCRANRVILLDVSWNPNHDMQASHRVYRYGQTKPCFVYRFVVGHSMEEKMLMKQIRKEELSKWSTERRVVSRTVHGGLADSQTLAATNDASNAKDAVATADPTHIKRFFDPPPPLSTLLAHPTSVRLPRAVLSDYVTSHILRTYSNPPKKITAAADATAEPNTWILSAFEQHTLIDDETDATNIFDDGDEQRGTNVKAAPSSTTTAAATTTTVTASSASSPAYWFGRVPTGTKSTTSASSPSAPASSTSSSAAATSSRPSGGSSRSQSPVPSIFAAKPTSTAHHPTAAPPARLASAKSSSAGVTPHQTARHQMTNSGSTEKSSTRDERTNEKHKNKDKSMSKNRDKDKSLSSKPHTHTSSPSPAAIRPPVPTSATTLAREVVPIDDDTETASRPRHVASTAAAVPPSIVHVDDAAAASSSSSTAPATSVSVSHSSSHLLEKRVQLVEDRKQKRESEETLQFIHAQKEDKARKLREAEIARVKAEWQAKIAQAKAAVAAADTALAQRASAAHSAPADSRDRDQPRHPDRSRDRDRDRPRDRDRDRERDRHRGRDRDRDDSRERDRQRERERDGHRERTESTPKHANTTDPSPPATTSTNLTPSATIGPTPNTDVGSAASAPVIRTDGASERGDSSAQDQVRGDAPGTISQLVTGPSPMIATAPHAATSSLALPTPAAPHATGPTPMPTSESPASASALAPTPVPVSMTAPLASTPPPMSEPRSVLVTPSPGLGGASTTHAAPLDTTDASRDVRTNVPVSPATNSVTASVLSPREGRFEPARTARLDQERKEASASKVTSLPMPPPPPPPPPPPTTAKSHAQAYTTPHSSNTPARLPPPQTQTHSTMQPAFVPATMSAQMQMVQQMHQQQQRQQDQHHQHHQQQQPPQPQPSPSPFQLPLPPNAYAHLHPSHLPVQVQVQAPAPPPSHPYPSSYPPPPSAHPAYPHTQFPPPAPFAQPPSPFPSKPQSQPQWPADDLWAAACARAAPTQTQATNPFAAIIQPHQTHAAQPTHALAYMQTPQTPMGYMFPHGYPPGMAGMQ